MADVTPFDEGPQSVENMFAVTVAANVPPGNYDVRCQGKYGLSNRRTFVVNGTPEFTEIEPNGGSDLPAWVEVESVRTNAAQEVTLPVMHASALLYLRSRDGSLRTGSSVSATCRWPAAFQWPSTR